MRLLRADSKFFLLLLVIAGIFLNSCKKKDTDDECPNCPTVTAISPTSAHGFDQLTITGNNFSSDPQSNIVKINGVQIDPDSILSGSTSELIVKVPRLCGSGKVTVDVDAELTNFGTPPEFTYLYTYSVIDIGGTGNNILPCGAGSACVVGIYLYPNGIGLDQSENVYFSDTYANCIYKLDASDNYNPCMFAGCGGTQGHANGNGTSASFESPYFFTIDNNNNLFASEYGNTIRSISPNGTVGNFVMNNSLSGLRGLAFDRYNPNILYACKTGFPKIMKISRIGNTYVVVPIAGTGDPGNSDGPDSLSTFGTPTGMVVDRVGNIYVSDMINNTIRKITPGGYVTTIAGRFNSGFINGQGAAAAFNGPCGLFINEQDEIFVADKSNGAIRKVTTSGMVTTVYQFSNSMSDVKPNSVVQDRQGNFYLTYTSDSLNGVKKIILN